MTRTILAGALMAAVLLGAPFVASADAGHGQGKDADATSKDEHHEASEGHGTAPMRSTTPAGAWTELMAARDAIASDIENDALGEIHEKSEPLAELAAELLERSGDLDAGKRARVEAAIKHVARVADALHVAADSEDAAATRKALSQLDGVLKSIRKQYPAGALDTETHEMPGHDDHSVAPGRGHAEHAHMQRPKGVVDTPPQAVVRVRAFDRLRFEPKRIEIRAGIPTRIELANVGAIEHALVVKTPDGEQDWVHLHVPPGATESATYQLDTPGTYPVLCTIPGHTEGGMIGELVVLSAHDPTHQDR